MDHTLYGFTDVLTHLGCRDNTRKALIPSLVFANFSHLTAVNTQAGLSEKVYLLNHAFHHGLAASHHPCSVPVKNDDDLVKLQNCIYTFALANLSRLWKDNSHVQFTMQILHSLLYWLCRKDIISVRPVIR